MKSLFDEKSNVSDKTIQMDNRITVNSKETNEERLVLLAKEKAEDQKWDQFQDRGSEHGLLQFEELGKHSQLETFKLKPEATEPL